MSKKARKVQGVCGDWSVLCMALGVEACVSVILTRPGLGGVEGMLVFANAAGCVLGCLGVSCDDCIGKALVCSEYST